MLTFNLQNFKKTNQYCFSKLSFQPLSPKEEGNYIFVGFTNEYTLVAFMFT